MEELFIFGEYLELETPIGICHFVKTKDYPKLMQYIYTMHLDKADIIPLIDQEYKSHFEEVSFIDIINFFHEGDLNLQHAFKELFNFIFHEDVFHKIKTDSELNYYLDLIKKMNHITYEKPNPNPEIEYYNKLERMMQQQKGEVLTLKAMITSAWLYTNPFELTIYQLYALFDRISNFKTLDMTTLFASHGGGSDINAWYKDVDLSKKDSIKLSEEDKNFANNHMSMIPSKKINNN